MDQRSPSPSFATDALADFEEVVFLRDPRSGARAIVAVHDTTLGPAFGGIRRMAYAGMDAALADVLALARAMTWKCAMAGVPAGGGKAVILDRPGLDRAAAYRLVGDAVARLGGRFHTGPDVGTTDGDLAVVASRTSHCATKAHGDLGGSTADGVFAAMRATAAHAGFDLAKATVLVQGVGAVGQPLCERLHAHGARLVVTDVDGARAVQVAARLRARVVPADQATTVACDVFAPCAIGGVLDERVAEKLPARAVCGAANNVLANEAAGRVLHRRGVPVAPDFVANAGGLVHGVCVELFGQQPERERFLRIGETVARVLAESRAKDVPPEVVALQHARERIRRSAADSAPRA